MSRQQVWAYVLTLSELIGQFEEVEPEIAILDAEDLDDPRVQEVLQAAFEVRDALDARLDLLDRLLDS